MSDFDVLMAQADDVIFSQFGEEARCRDGAGQYFVAQVDVLKNIESLTPDGYVQGIETHIEILRPPRDFGEGGLVFVDGECWRLVSRVRFDANVAVWLVAPMSDHDFEVAEELMPDLNEAVTRGWS